MKYAFLICLLFSLFDVVGQNNGEIKGTIVDAKGNPMEKATVSVVSAVDSIVVAYSLSNIKGQFDMVHLPTQKKLTLFISHISGTPYEQQLTLKPNEKRDLEHIVMGALSIDEVVVARRPPISLNGDTLEYKADYFKTRPNATVEELLQLLPGIQVNADGTLFYQGKQVSGIRVNGKDFFVDDITIATKNLDASLIDVVQIVKDRGESKKEILDDENLPVILNLKTKKEFLKANFGKFYAGGGTRGRYESGALVNTFRDTLQISFIGYSNNINRSGFDYSELSEYGGYRRGENNSNQVFYYGMGGLKREISLGLNMNYDIKKKLKVNLMYNFLNENNRRNSQQEADNFYGDITENNHSTSKSASSKNGHSVRAFVRYLPDTTWRLSLDMRVGRLTGRNESNREHAQFRQPDIQVRDGHSANEGNYGNPTYTHNFNVEKKISPQLIFSFLHSTKSSASFDENIRGAYDRYFLFGDSTVDEAQRNEQREKSLSTDNRLGVQWKHHEKFFTEYYTKYNWSYDRQEYDLWHKVNSDKFENRNDVTNDLEAKVGYFVSGVKMGATVFKKLKLEGGVEYVDLSRDYGFYGKKDDTSYHQQYLLSYAYAGYRKLSFNYSQRVEKPGLYYFQVVDTKDLNVTYETLASTDFDNRISNNFSLWYYTTTKRYKININTSLRFSRYDNSIAYRRTYDTSNSYSTSQAYQTLGTDSYGADLSLSKVFIQKKDWRLNLSISNYMNMWQGYAMINGEENLNSDYYWSIRNMLTLSYKNKVTFTPTYNMNFNYHKNSSNSDYFKDFKNVRHAIGGTFLWNDFYKFRLETSYTLNNQNVSLNQKQNFHLVNASVYYPVWKKGELKLTGFDLLNQSQSSWIYSSGNSTAFAHEMVLRQYFLLGFVYKFLNTTNK